MKPAKKTDAELKRAETWFETVSQLSGFLVFIGLVVEVWGAVEYRPAGVSITQTWEPAVSTILVAIGVFFEIMFGRWALQQAGELRHRAEIALAEATERAGRAVERAAEANERAANIERLTGRRRIPVEQQLLIIELLRPIGKMLDVYIEYQAGDSEAWLYANELSYIFKGAGAIIDGRQNSFPYETMFGLFISAAPAVDIALLADAFEKGKVFFTVRRYDPLWMAPKRPAPNIRMFVAVKPPAEAPIFPYAIGEHSQT